MATPLKERPHVKKMLAAAKAAGARLHGAAKGAKGTGIAAVSGAVTGVAIDQLEQRVQFLGDHWYLTPILGIVGGHLVTKKHATVGAAVVGASAAMFIGAYRANQATQAQQQPAQSAQGLPAGNAGRVADRVFAPVSHQSAGALPAGNAGRVAGTVDFRSAARAMRRA